jgi:ketosteroid isomerase-like protein
MPFRGRGLGKGRASGAEARMVLLGPEPKETTMATRSLKHQSSNDEAEIRGILEKVRKAHRSKDAAALIAPYAGDATIFDLAPPLSHRGNNLQEVQAWLDTWDGPIDLETGDLNISVDGDLAFCHGVSRLSGTKTGDGPVSIWMRATACLRRTGGGWRIVHEHTSVPFYMDGSFRAAVDLKP